MLHRSILPAFSRRSLGRHLRRCSISGAAKNTTARAFGHLFIFPIQHYNHFNKYAKRTTHCHTSPSVIATQISPVIAALDAAISFYIDCRVKPDNDKGGNDRLILSLRGAKRRGNPVYTYQNAFLQLWHAKKKRGNYINYHACIKNNS